MSLLTFKKGVHPPASKTATASQPIEEAPMPDTLMVPLSQHLGAPSSPVKSRGDEVEVGELLSEASSKISANIHSPAAGKIKRIVDKPLPGGKMAQYMEITVDHERTAAHSFERQEVDISSLDRQTVVTSMRNAGIVGMGGATFPADVKFSPPPTAPVDTLIINGVECEPYLTCDHRLMLEHTEQLLEACRVLNAAYGFDSIYIGIEANKPDAVEAFEKQAATYADLPLRIVPLEVKYPQGAEKMLIKALTDRTVPMGGLPMEVGVIVSNVQTIFAAYEAIYYNKPLIERVVTVSGRGVDTPKNVRAAVGTPLESLVEFCGGMSQEVDKVVAGGPMTGAALPTLDYSVAKGTSGFLFFTEAEYQPEGPCIRCGRCVAACPMNLMPLKLAAYSKAEKFEDAKALDVNACFECGACAFGCPAKIDLVAWMRYAKNYIRVKGL
ncbi:MAG: electron transport complex subunit RsxC [Spirochaetota bacterium]